MDQNFHRRAAAASLRRSPLFEITLVLVRLDQSASRIVNADHGIM
jgi:hypothetical protein